MPARLIPSHPIDEIDHGPERDVCRALVTQLPSNCVVIHSYPWLYPERGASTERRHLREGEVDFIVLHPEWGTLFVEVKGGRISYDSSNRIWKRIKGNGVIDEIKDPFFQVQHNMHEILKQVRATAFPSLNEVPGTHGYAVIFPDCDLKGPPPPGADLSMLFTAKDLTHLSGRIEKAFKDWSSGGQGGGLGTKDVEAIHAALLPAVSLELNRPRRHKHDEEQLVRLTSQQYGVMVAMSRTNRLAVEGPAGSGKSMLAIHRALSFAKSGIDALYLCYNRALAEWLGETYTHEHLKVRHFHGLTSTLCSEAKIPFHPDTKSPEDTQRFWREDAPGLLMQAIDRVKMRFGAIAVDEGQDFSADWWVPIQLLLANAETDPFYVFYDRNQNIYLQEPAIPALGQTLNLPANCRNTRCIAGSAGAVRDITMPVWHSAPKGEPPKVHVWGNAEDALLRVEETVRDWISRGGYKPSQIAILGSHSRAKSCFANVSSVAGIAISENLSQWVQGKAIHYSSARGFKGLEADAIVIVDVEEYTPTFTPSDLYVACSRAKHELVVLCTNKEIAKRLKTDTSVVVDAPLVS